MSRLIVLFDLKAGVSPADYERWVTEAEYPVVRALESIERYDVHAVTGLMGSDAAPPYQYVEVIDVGDMARFGEEASSEVMQEIVAAFGAFADAPQFLLTRTVGADS